MSPPRVLALPMRLLLALWLGLGPLGAQALENLLHAPFCACCAAPALAAKDASSRVSSGNTAAGDCCAKPERAPDEPRWAPDKACSCALVAPAGAPVPALAPRTADARVETRAHLERIRLAFAPIARAPELDLCLVGPPGTRDDPGPPGVHRLHGAARAAALGALLL